VNLLHELGHKNQSTNQIMEIQGWAGAEVEVGWGQNLSLHVSDFKDAS